MSFLYSLNRLNVATSRARVLAVVVASLHLLDVVPGSPDQLGMANSLTYLSMINGQEPDQDPGRPSARISPG
jgi:superfamily I DNA and/or RNA helicase